VVGQLSSREHDALLTAFAPSGASADARARARGRRLRLAATALLVSGVLTRVAVCEAPIDALSLAALEGVRADTLYVATSGDRGPHTLAGLDALLQGLADQPESVLVAATDADATGEHYAAHLATMAQAAGVRSERLAPSDGQKDWNDALKQGRGA